MFLQVLAAVSMIASGTLDSHGLNPPALTLLHNLQLCYGYSLRVVTRTLGMLKTGVFSEW